ncbi:angiogenic factor with G patch and FHA domains 1 isoform X1 [Tachysurus fulvidraco]|uniref:angiogenic factor with G patch and FHA domains 1 isoform X1 n=1 Tax=Tachysurus fulvidraco TaxID=1234273 RepID=UPI001FF06D96|nr:angiogenic factor with G patch and FHA domains 1 isoform X1 [Tachysurus fulvidraco]XP_027008614.2 angiogenic factor with G patch and FHA domains 1 isoform X1 [Tachysurus fulvidraco]
MERETDITVQMEEKSVSLEDKCKSVPTVFKEDEIPVVQMKDLCKFEGTNPIKDDKSKSEPQDVLLGSEVACQKTEGCGSEVSGLQMEMRSLQQELWKCQVELKRVQKQLDQSLRLQRSTESFNHDLRQQVEELSAELHERKKKDKSRVEAETQTEDYSQFETDYSYYYSGYYQAAAEPVYNTATEIQETSEIYPVAAETEAASLQQSDEVNVTDTEVVDSSSSSIAAMLRATAEEAVTQTGFVFDENSGMYYDHSTGFYYDSNTQLYYDANTGIYYYYDHSSGKYQFHSRIELSTVQQGQTANDQENVSKWKRKRTTEKQEAQAKCLNLIKSQNHSGTKERSKDAKNQEEHCMGKKGETVIQRKGKRSQSKTRLSRSLSRTRLSRSRSRTRLSRSRSRTRLSRSQSRTRLSRSRSRTRLSRSLSRTRLSRSLSRTRLSRSRSRSRLSRSRSKSRLSRSRSRTRLSRSRTRLRRQKKSHSEERKKKKKKKKNKRQSHMHRDSGSHTTNMDGESEPEEGEILQSRPKKYPSPSSSSASPSPPPLTSPVSYSPETDMLPLEEGWPPCVRVIVVRSPVLQHGTLFILTADSIATIGREKDMDHAIRIPEIGVSKCHAEVYFDQDQQCYMLVDRGSQNGTVINGNRILQPKVRCDPCPLTHGDEVKLGETVLSFHIHVGSDTCDACEPGQVRAHLSYRRSEENTGVMLSKEDKELQRVRQLKQIKLKYGLKNSGYEGGGVLSNKYKDRAENRRQTVGSEGTFYRDDAPASVHVEISDKNKGRQMLERMGWKSGKGLGKDGGGITEPVDVQVRAPQSGLGCGAKLSVDEVPTGRSRRQQNWEHARERFQNADLGQVKTDSGDILLSDPGFEI